MSKVISQHCRIEFAEAAWGCGHLDNFPVKLLAHKREEIEGRKCPECRALDTINAGGHLGTGRIYMGQGQPTVGREEVVEAIANKRRAA